MHCSTISLLIFLEGQFACQSQKRHASYHAPLPQQLGDIACPNIGATIEYISGLSMVISEGRLQYFCEVIRMQSSNVTVATCWLIAVQLNITLNKNVAYTV